MSGLGDYRKNGRGNNVRFTTRAEIGVSVVRRAIDLDDVDNLIIDEDGGGSTRRVRSDLIPQFNFDCGLINSNGDDTRIKGRKLLEKKGCKEITTSGLESAAFWDFQNCPIPLFKPVEIIDNILDVLRKSGLACSNKLDFYVYYDSLHNTSRTNKKIESIRVSKFGEGINAFIIDIHGEKANKDAADKEMITDIHVWASNHASPSNILIISGDGDFSKLVNFLCMKNYNIVLACDKNNCAKSLLNSALYSIDWKKMATGVLTYNYPKPDLQMMPRDVFQLNMSTINIWWDYKTCPLPEGMKILMDKLPRVIKESMKNAKLWGHVRIYVYAAANDLTPKEVEQFQNNDFKFWEIPHTSKEDASKMILHDMLSLKMDDTKQQYCTVVSDADMLSCFRGLTKSTSHIPIIIKSSKSTTNYIKDGIRVLDWSTTLSGLMTVLQRLQVS